MVHDLNCHLDFIKDKRGGGGGRTRKPGNERSEGRASARFFLLLVRPAPTCE